MGSTRYLFVVVILLACGCTIADEDRCVSGFTWDPSVEGCWKDDTDTGSDTGEDTDVGIDAGSDAGDLVDAGDDTGGQDVPSGFGDTCSLGGGECVGLEADYCLADANQGMCTVQGCTPGGCPSGSTCCDCTVVAMPVICIYDEVVADIMGKLCNCG